MHRSKHFSKTGCISSDEDMFYEIKLHGETDNLHVIIVIDALFVTVVKSEFAAFDYDGTSYVVSFFFVFRFMFLFQCTFVFYHTVHICFIFSFL